tara:strand:+ start:14075 stop:14281 length:207 start_codon:yes stop_codon:yes gene_type:complete
MFTDSQILAILKQAESGLINSSRSEVVNHLWLPLTTPEQIEIRELKKQTQRIELKKATVNSIGQCNTL